jgi:hypothetical protein
MIGTWGDFTKVVTFVIGAAFTGAVFDFIGYLGGPQLGGAIFAYPVGLLLALMWFYGTVAVENIKVENNRSRNLLGWGHMLGLVAINIVAAALVLPPAFHDAWNYAAK